MSRCICIDDLHGRVNRGCPVHGDHPTDEFETSNVLPFAPREVYEETRWNKRMSDTTELTKQEIFDGLKEETLEYCDRLIKFYRMTGKWNPTASEKMKKIIQDLMVVCEIMTNYEPEPIVIKGNDR